MKLIKVESTHIQAIGYEKAFKYDSNKRPRNTLRIVFNNNVVYDYLDVSESIFKDFLNAKSKGIYFEQKIKNRYTTLKRRIKNKGE